MQDQVIKGTGNSRYLKSSIPEDITLSELVAMLRAGTFPIDFNGLNEEGIQTLGTPLNTATLVNAAVGQAFGYIGLPKNRALTVADVLLGLSMKTGGQDPTEETVGQLGQFYWNSSSKVLYKCVNISGGKYTWQAVNNTFKVGDILTTTRNDSEDWWALCNGDEIDPAEYPELYKMTPISALPQGAIYNVVVGGSRLPKPRISFVNGYYFIATGDARDNSLRFYRRQEGVEAWSAFGSCSVNFNSGSSAVTQFGEYYVVAYDTGSAASSTNIGYSKNGSWAKKTIWQGGNGGGYTAGCIAAEGKLIISGCQYTSGTRNIQIAWCETITGNWSTKIIWSSSSAHRTNLKYLNGLYFVVGGHYDAETKCAARIAYADTIDGEWVIKDVWKSNARATIYDICYDGNRYIVCGEYENNDAETGSHISSARIAYADTLDGEWTIKDIVQTNNQPNSSYATVAVTSCNYENGIYILTGGHGVDGSTNTSRGFIAYNDELGRQWTMEDVLGINGVSTKYGTVTDGVYENGQFKFVGEEYSDKDGENKFYSEAGAYRMAKCLPTINTGDTYTYIKVKES